MSDRPLAPAAITRALEEQAEGRKLLKREYDRARHRERYANDPEYRERQREKSKQSKRRAHRKLTTAERLYRSAKMRAKREGVPFNLTVPYIRKLWPADGRCPVLGFRMLLDDAADVLPSLDRLNREAGYTVGNVRLISLRANRLKGDGHPHEMARVLAYTMFPKAYTFEDGNFLVEIVRGFEPL